jgi:hypothetical protein
MPQRTQRVRHPPKRAGQQVLIPPASHIRPQPVAQDGTTAVHRIAQTEGAADQKPSAREGRHGRSASGKGASVGSSTGGRTARDHDLEPRGVSRPERRTLTLFSRRDHRPGSFTLNLVGVLTVAFTLVVNLARGLPVVSLAAVLLTAAVHRIWVRAGKPAGSGTWLRTRRPTRQPERPQRNRRSSFGQPWCRPAARPEPASPHHRAGRLPGTGPRCPVILLRVPRIEVRRRWRGAVLPIRGFRTGERGACQPSRK